MVIEDIDALFAKDRSAKNNKSPLSFSGLLNALDGVGAASGQVCERPPWPPSPLSRQPPHRDALPLLPRRRTAAPYACFRCCYCRRHRRAAASFFTAAAAAPPLPPLPLPLHRAPTGTTRDGGRSTS